MPLIFGETASGLLVPVRVDDDGLLAGVGQGWVGAAWQKNPLLLGYSGDQTEQISDLNADEGTDTLASAAVPAGEIWIVEAVSARNLTKAEIRLLSYVVANGVDVVLQEHTTTIAAEFAVWSGAVTLSEGDTVNAIFYDCDAGDDLYLQYHARRIDIDQ